MILTIQTGKNNPILRQKAAPIGQITPQIKQLALDMAETLEANENNVGLAGPQVSQALRIIAFQPDPSQPARVLINPTILKKSRRTSLMEEGCLSLPEYTVKISRPVKITVQAADLNGNRIKLKAKDIPARIIQHEIDHLDGVLICDKPYA